jgi:transcriptional regulator with XRE-family HTH domain
MTLLARTETNLIMPLKVRPELPEYLREARLARGWSGAELAKRAGVAHNLPTNLERPEYLAEHRPTADTLIKIAGALNTDINLPEIDPSYLLYLAGYLKQDPTDIESRWPPEINRLVNFLLDIGNPKLRAGAIKTAIGAARLFLGINRGEEGEAGDD